MNKIIIYYLTAPLFFVSLIFNYHFLYKKQSLEIFNNKEIKIKEQSEEEEEEITNIPWTYTWKGVICSLLISALISIIIADNMVFEQDILVKGNIIIYFILFLFPLEVLISPFVLALKKFGKRSYFQRLPKVYSASKIFIDFIISAFFLHDITVICSFRELVIDRLNICSKIKKNKINYN